MYFTGLSVQDLWGRSGPWPASGFWWQPRPHSYTLCCGSLRRLKWFLHSLPVTKAEDDKARVAPGHCPVFKKGKEMLYHETQQGSFKEVQTPQYTVFGATFLKNCLKKQKQEL